MTANKKLSDRDLRVIARKLKPQGWTCQHTPGGHVVWIGPKGQRVYGACTSGGGRGTRNLIGLLRRNGAEI